MATILQDAINLIKQGQKLEARGMLETLLRSNPQDVSAWFWYAETLETLEKRVKVLELCLKANPGNPQAEKALAIMRTRLSDSSPPPAPVETKPAFDWNSKPATFAEPEADDTESNSAFDWNDQPARSQPAAIQWESESTSAIDWDDEAAPVSNIDWDAIEQQQAPKTTEWQYEPSPEVTAVESKPPSPSYSFFDVWLTALTNGNEREYQALLLDPHATQGRAYEWMGYIGLISGLLLPIAALTSGVLNQPEFQQILGTVDQTMFLVILGGAGAILSCISAVLGLMINGGVQFLIAKALGGGGTYTRTVYALGAYLAPLTLISTVISAIPLVNCLSILIGIYSIVLNVRALKAAHYMDTSRALMVVFLPGILIFIVMCLIGLFAAPVIGDMLPSMP
ncbi:MAG: YIP1 family protein [Anaerolineae bacterium]|nr:YIP1 family protein [Anaerolineae bacterium]